MRVIAFERVTFIFTLFVVELLGKRKQPNHRNLSKLS